MNATLFPHRSTPLLFQKGGEAALISVCLSLLSILFFLGALISSTLVLSLAAGLKQRIPSADEAKYGQYWHVPGFNWQGYLSGQLIGEFCLLVGAGLMILALCASYISFFRSRKTAGQRARRTARWGMFLSHFSLLLGILAFVVVGQALFALFLWGFSMF